ncbi:hypothetical protein K227x_37730 [Rubripirellula lacrimiformis]|uniref:Uncharacterized protein n=1 Tax=Rubripirellula lacrimiformis TaxID=1930273 RepID=A0A517NE13_9BACT|nr:hypothetical protein K227x_37730 [Rubripirellula lacrimiformis]
MYRYRRSRTVGMSRQVGTFPSTLNPIRPPIVRPPVHRRESRGWLRIQHLGHSIWDTAVGRIWALGLGFRLLPGRRAFAIQVGVATDQHVLQDHIRMVCIQAFGDQFIAGLRFDQA